MTEPWPDPVPDADLLRRYTQAGDRDAFTALVTRHLGFVHAAARRQIGDTHLADDVTQAVFIVLARKAGSIGDGVPLAGWLFTVTRHAAQNAMRMRNRQLVHERRAAEAAREMSPVDSALDSQEEFARLRSLLDDSIARLPVVERDGVLLHFFHGHTHEQVGQALGLSAEAARKRVSRAVAKLREMFIARGAVGVPLVAVTGMLHHEAGAAAALAPTPGVAASTANVALISTGAMGATASTASLNIAQGVNRMFAFAKLKTAAVVAASMTAVAGMATAGTMIAISGARTAVPLTATSLTTSHTAQPDPTFTTTVDDKTKVRFLGVSKYPPQDESWISIAGEPIDPPALPGERGRISAEPPPEFQAVFEITLPRDVVVMLEVDGAMMVANQKTDSTDGDDRSLFLVSSFAFQNLPETTGFTLGFATKAWTNIGTYDAPADEGGIEIENFGRFTFAPVRAGDGGSAIVEVTHPERREPLRVNAIDDAGREIESNHVNINGDGETCTGTYTFELPPEKIKKLVVQAREFSHKVVVENVSLSADRKTEPKIEVKSKE